MLPPPGKVSVQKGFTHEQTLHFLKDGCWKANGAKRNPWGNCNGIQCVPLTNPSNVPFDEINVPWDYPDVAWRYPEPGCPTDIRNGVNNRLDPWTIDTCPYPRPFTTDFSQNPQEGTTCTANEL